jgi:hypothetical protein
MDNDEKRISELYMASLMAFKDQAPFKGKGVINGRFSEKVQVAFTADEGMKFNADQWGEQLLKPFWVYIWQNGWLVALLNPESGQFLENRNLDTEDRLIDILNKMLPSSSPESDTKEG